MMNLDSEVYGVNNANRNGSVEVKEGILRVKNPQGSGKYAEVISDGTGYLCVNGNRVLTRTMVKEGDEILYTRDVVKGKRIIDIRTNEDKTEANISIVYEKGFKYKLKDSAVSHSLVLELNEVEAELPPMYTVAEVVEYLQKNKIIFGIDREKLKEVENNREIKDLCIAKSVKAIDPINDKVLIYVNKEKGYENEESMKKVDYKNIISFQSVKKGDIIAEIVKGSIGKDGITIYAKKIKSKQTKKLKIKVGNGCLLENNKIIATIDGKVSTSKNNFKVNKLHTVNGDVDIKSGNINFTGSVTIKGKVTEGMSVVANSLEVAKGAFKTNIQANESSIILGNIFDSKIKIGGQGLDNKNAIENLKMLKEQLESLVKNIIYLRSKNLVDSKIADGYLVKTLMESKYKTITKLCVHIISPEINILSENTKLISLIRSRLTGLCPICIKSYTEVEEIVQEINRQIGILESENSITSDLTIEYCQESKIDVSGDVSIVGKGSYTSQIFAKKKIEFTSEDSVCRGGHLKAEALIKVNAVGSRSGVVTELEVGKNGHIYAQIAYHNTVFIVGKRRGSVEEDARDVHVYTDKSGEMVIEKLYL